MIRIFRGHTGIYLLEYLYLFLITVVFGFSCTTDKSDGSKFGFAVHGGAGTISRENLTPGLEAEYSAKLTEALYGGYQILKVGGSSLNAVEAAIRILEDSPLFNAGKGAVFTNTGTNELDASIMDGKTLNGGAVAAVKRIKNPITLARLVMDQSPHILLAGEGAENFAREHNMKWVSPDYFFTEKRWKQLQKMKNKKTDHSAEINRRFKNILLNSEEKQVGTVGAVALDKNGNLAAGTSTGGMSNKKFGRIGDSPILGAGTYANNKSCAVSCTGHGEYFMRLMVAYQVSALMTYRGMSVKAAANDVVNKTLTDLGGKGGIIAIDKNGNIAMPFNTQGMYRGYVNNNGKVTVKIFRE